MYEGILRLNCISKNCVMMRVITPEIFTPKFDTTFYLCSLEDAKTDIDLDLGESEEFIWEESNRILDYFKQKKTDSISSSGADSGYSNTRHNYSKLLLILSKLNPIPIIPEISEFPQHVLLLRDYLYPHTPLELRNARYEYYFTFDPNNPYYRWSAGLSTIFSRL